MVYTVLLGNYLDEIFHIANFPLLFPCVLYCLLPNWWRLIDILYSALRSPINVSYFESFHLLLAFAPSYSFRTAPARLLSLMPIASNEVFGNLFRPPDRIVRLCVSVLVYEVSKSIAFAYTTDNAIDFVFTRRDCEFFCGNLSSAFVDFVVLFVDWLVWFVHELSLYVFHRWCQSSSVD